MLIVSPTVSAALQSDSLAFAWLIAFPNMADVTTGLTGVFFTDAATDILFQGDLYKSAGDILSLPGVVRERGIKLQGYSFTLAGADQSNAVRLAAGNLTGQTGEVFLVLLDAAGGVIGGVPGGEAISMYKGTFHTWQERESGASSTVQVTLTSPWSKPNLTAGRITSNNNQQENYPGDDFFKFAHRERKNIGWGGEK
jgi:hypothetical protein